MAPGGLGYQISRNDVASLTYQLVYGQQYEGFALYKFVSWLPGEPIRKQKQRTVQALALTYNNVIIALVDPKRYDLARLMYQTVSSSIPCGLCGKKATAEVQALTTTSIMRRRP